MVEEHLISYGYLMLAFGLGGLVAIVSAWIASLLTRSAYTDEPVFSKEEAIEYNLEDIEEEMAVETDDERYERERAELEYLRGSL